MTGLARLRFPLVVLLALTVQTTLLSGIRVLGVHPDVLLAVAAAAGIVARPERAAIAGFAVGLVEDLMILQTPVGLAALTFCLVAIVVATIQGGMLRASRWINPLTVGLASAGGELLFAVIGVLVGQSLVRHGLPQTVGLVGLMNAVLALAVVPLVSWSLPQTDATRTYAR